MMMKWKKNSSSNSTTFAQQNADPKIELQSLY